MAWSSPDGDPVFSTPVSVTVIHANTVALRLTVVGIGDVLGGSTDIGDVEQALADVYAALDAHADLTVNNMARDYSVHQDYTP